VQEAYRILLEEAKNISTAQDLDYLFAQLKGEGSEILQKAIEEEEKQEEELKITAVSMKAP
jgi:Zn-dependent M32 family carboxypeptidase